MISRKFFKFPLRIFKSMTYLKKNVHSLCYSRRDNSHGHLSMSFLKLTATPTPHAHDHAVVQQKECH